MSGQNVRKEEGKENAGEEPGDSGVAILFSDFGPYHIARIEALARAVEHQGMHLVAVRFKIFSQTYAWRPCTPSSVICETLSGTSLWNRGAIAIVIAWGRLIVRRGISVAFLPSYWPLPNALCLVVAKLLRCKCIMMNESWSGTERAKGISRLCKRAMLYLFDGALVGGSRHKAHFEALGMRSHLIAKGYDVVDNDFFGAKSSAIRGAPRPLGFPENYFLSLGRMVPKKNLTCLIKAYAQLVKNQSESVPSLVLVGDGPERRPLMELAQTLGLQVSECEGVGDPVTQSGPSAVIFFRFAQIEDTAKFYAWARAFVLPSLWEEWGLVVNEAMACGLPVVVSANCGCSSDLVEEGVNGFTFDPTDSESLARCLSRYINDPGLTPRQGCESLRIISDYGPSRFAEEGLELLKKLRTT